VYLERHSLTGSQGSGIRVIEGEEIGTSAPLYVQYIKKKAEYRVHVFRGQVIDVQQKRKQREFEGEIDTRIRNHSRGWVFCRDGVSLPGDSARMCISACQILGLDFGAVDVIWNDKQKQAYVLEINTAPGIEGTTVESYGRAILEAL
jgi:glutathione synthase/RimK-type ligase-like ATP-grasp enzyme